MVILVPNIVTQGEVVGMNIDYMYITQRWTVFTEYICTILISSFSFFFVIVWNGSDAIKNIYVILSSQQKSGLLNGGKNWIRRMRYIVGIKNGIKNIKFIKAFSPSQKSSHKAMLDYYVIKERLWQLISVMTVWFRLIVHF